MCTFGGWRKRGREEHRTRWRRRKGRTNGERTNLTFSAHGWNPEALLGKWTSFSLTILLLLVCALAHNKLSAASCHAARFSVLRSRFSPFRPFSPSAIEPSAPSSSRTLRRRWTFWRRGQPAAVDNLLPDNGEASEAREREKESPAYIPISFQPFDSDNSVYRYARVYSSAKTAVVCCINHANEQANDKTQWDKIGMIISSCPVRVLPLSRFAIGILTIMPFCSSKTMKAKVSWRLASLIADPK